MTREAPRRCLRIGFHPQFIHSVRSHQLPSSAAGGAAILSSTGPPPYLNLPSSAFPMSLRKVSAPLASQCAMLGSLQLLCGLKTTRHAENTKIAEMPPIYQPLALASDLHL